MPNKQSFTCTDLRRLPLIFITLVALSGGGCSLLAIDPLPQSTVAGEERRRDDEDHREDVRTAPRDQPVSAPPPANHQSPDKVMATSLRVARVTVAAELPDRVGAGRRQTRDDAPAVTPGYRSQRSQPGTYAEAVQAVVESDRTIREALAAENDDAAHGPLHEILHLLQATNGLAAERDMNGRQRQSVQIAVAKLREAFRAVDATMHGKEGMCYAEVSFEIRENLQILKDACAI